MKKGDYGQKLNFYLKKPDGTIVPDLDTATSIHLYIQLNNGSVIEKDCTLENKDTGLVSYIMDEGVLSDIGILSMEVEVRFADAKFTSETFQDRIFPRIKVA